MFYRRCLRHSVVSFIISHVIDYLSSMTAIIGLFVLLGLHLGPILPASSWMDELVVEVVVVVLVEISVGHDGGLGFPNDSVLRKAQYLLDSR